MQLEDTVKLGAAFWTINFQIRQTFLRMLLQAKFELLVSPEITFSRRHP
jgi:hypothetical protein